MFRLNPGMTEICKVQTHLGEGKVLQMTETLKELLRQAWYYYPYDCWYGTYENGEVTLQQKYKAYSAVEWVAIENIHIENVHHSNNNKIKLRFKAVESKTVNVRMESYQSSDNLGGLDSKEVELIKGKESTVEFVFGGFYNCVYEVSIMIDNTRITLTVNPAASATDEMILKVYGIGPGLKNLQISEEQSNTLRKIWDGCEWENAVTETVYDYVFTDGDRKVHYSYDEGIFNDVTNLKSVILTSELRTVINNVIDNLVVLPTVD